VAFVVLPASMAAMRVLIVGAGMSGLTAANVLVADGHEVTIVEKGRAVGGRMATKRLHGARFDFGAQHFSARSPEFESAVESMRSAGVIDTWFTGQSVTEPDRGLEPRLKGFPAMRSIAEHLAGGLDVRVGHLVESISVNAGIAIDGVDPVDQCIVTAPLPQTLALVGSHISAADGDRLASVRYEPCLAALLVLDRPSGLTGGHLALDDGPIAWMADNQQKGVSEIPAVTVHSSHAFASEHLEETPEQWLPGLVEAAQQHLSGGVVRSHGHRWRYSLPAEPLDVGALRVHDRIVVAGEALSGAKIEGAFLSGLAAARLIGPA
jgi:renalase